MIVSKGVQNKTDDLACGSEIICGIAECNHFKKDDFDSTSLTSYPPKKGTALVYHNPGHAKNAQNHVQLRMRRERKVRSPNFMIK